MKRLSLALVIIVVFALVEIIGGWLSGSLALLADAGHMVTDAAALGLALSAQWLARRPASLRFPFGFKRAQVLAAFVNGLVLLLIVCVLVFEAFGRFSSPTEIDTRLMLTVACIGLVANLAAFVILHPDARHDVNIRGAMLHVAADIFGSAAAIASALVIMATGWFAIDAVLTLAVCLLIVRSAVPLIQDTANVLLQAAPPGLDLDEVREAITAQPGVLDANGIKAWQLTPGDNLITVHVVVSAGSLHDATLRSVKGVLRDQFGLTQSTVQIEVEPAPGPHQRWAETSTIHEPAE
ncbi:MAG: cation diffusion facilitator family transporter [Pseudomonadota bacterium]